MSTLLEVINEPAEDTWDTLVSRPPANDDPGIRERVAEILAGVRRGGADAVVEYTAAFDRVSLSTASLRVSPSEIAEGASLVAPALRDAILLARKNIEKFHAAQVEPLSEVETSPGVLCWRRSIPIQNVGLYIPGGSAPLFSTLLMLAIPARLAGCPRLVVCTPPRADGSLDPAILFVAENLGITDLFRVGGAQAIGAMAYGAAPVPRVDKIFGPGNLWVTVAKQLVSQSHVAIDLPAGPSEVAVFADQTANPAFVAADLLSQAEHGKDSQVLLVATSSSIVAAVTSALATQLPRLPRRDIAAAALAGSRAVVIADRKVAMNFLNRYAPEHLILSSDDADDIAKLVVNAGSVFLGHLTPESVGDYASGTNHTLPTNGFARAYAGVSLDSFVKKVTFQRLSAKGLDTIGPAVEIMADAEGLAAHREAVRIRREGAR